jgi:phage baseplate assembly protein W
MARTRLYKTTKVAENVQSLGGQAGASFVYKGFKSTNSKKNFKEFDTDLIKQDLLNHFHIRKGEKLENPDFGTVIWDMLFEPFTQETKELIAKDVETIVNYDPRISVNAVQIDSTDMGMRIQVDLTYIPFNINEKIALDFDRSNALN